MKAFTVLAVALIGASQAAHLQGVSDSLAHSVIRAKWSSYKAQHGKAYEHAHEETLRMNNFLTATQIIEEHNARYHQGLETFTMGHNSHSDLSLAEIMSTKTGLVMPANAEEMRANMSNHVKSEDIEYPEEFDWTNYGGVTPVKNQGGCGSCYTFSAIGAIETAHWRRNGELIDLSEQHLLDCSEQYGSYGCEGGWMHTAFEWARDNQGVLGQTDLPYAAEAGTCRLAGDNAKANLHSHNMVKNEEELLDALVHWGTISIGYNAGTTAHAYYQGGILDAPDCGRTPNHAVLVVGYGVENGVEYWRLKNSWGTGWGEEGFFRMVRGKNMCGIGDWGSYPISL